MLVKLRLTFVTVTVVFFSQQSHAVAPTAYTGSITYGNDDNLTLGYLDQDILGDDNFNLSFDVSHTVRLNTKNKLKLSLTPGITSYNKYDGLNNKLIDLKANYLFQFSNHFRSPQFGVYYLTGTTDYKNDLRDNSHSQYGMNINFHYDDRTLLRAGFSSETVDADTTFDPGTGNFYQTFDTSRDTTYFGINITQTSKLSLYASYSLISGDIVANWTNNTINALPNATQVAWETIPDTTFANNWSSTKYNADITKIAIGFNYAFGPSSAIDSVFESLDADAGNYSYAIKRMSLSYLHRF